MAAAASCFVFPFVVLFGVPFVTACGFWFSCGCDGEGVELLDVLGALPVGEAGEFGWAGAGGCA